MPKKVPAVITPNGSHVGGMMEPGDESFYSPASALTSHRTAE
jgi:hypothetical protein